MATESLELVEVLKVPPERLYRAWLDSKEHSAMTGTPTTIQPVEGATFEASEGYIRGINVLLEPNRRIVQNWRTTEFPPGAPPSRLEVLFEEDPEGTRVVLRQTEIPEGQAERYREGWREYYFSPMSDYFGAEERNPPTDTLNVPPEGEGAPPVGTLTGTGPASGDAELPIDQARGSTDMATPPSQRRAMKKPAAKRPVRAKVPAKKAAAKKAPAKKKAATSAKKGKPVGRKTAKATVKKATQRAQKLVARAERGVKKGAARTGGVRKATAAKGKAKAAPAKKGATKKKTAARRR